MRSRFHLLFFIALTSIVLAACSKKDSDEPGADGGGGNYGSGTLFFDWATEGIQKIDLQSGTKSTVLPSDTKRHSWNITADGSKALLNMSDPDNVDGNIYIVINVADGKVLSQFKFTPKGSRYNAIRLSPSGNMIGVTPTFEEGAIILNAQGKVLVHLENVNGEKLHRQLCWMPDETLLLSFGKYLIRTDKTFKQAALVKEMDFQEWGDVSVSPDGSKIAFRGGNHLYMMNADGSNMVQVTQGGGVEAEPVFSPDGQWLAAGRNHRQTGPFGYIRDVIIFPADGKNYNVDEGADKSVLALIPKGENKIQNASGHMEWR
ncbi:MAG: PD40 domain-containing protein [Mucilaginibacter polytrichastri]|nr:PD40 domain-containing protein [Mucilaginibacter polytrichastri]